MTRTEAAEIIEQIYRLHEIATPINVIARTLHLPQRVVVSALQSGTIPNCQPVWTDPSRKESAR